MKENTCKKIKNRKVEAQQIDDNNNVGACIIIYSPSSTSLLLFTRCAMPTNHTTLLKHSPVPTGPVVGMMDGAGKN